MTTTRVQHLVFGTPPRLPRVLLVGADAASAVALAGCLSSDPCHVECVSKGAAAVRLIAGEPFDVILAHLPAGQDDGGLAVLRAARRHQPHAPLVALVPLEDLATAVAAARLGASEVLARPVDTERLAQIIRRSLAASPHRAFCPDPERPCGDSPAFRAALARARAAAGSDGTVLLTGETGSGKEVFARYIHRLSRQREGPFVAVNCAAIPEPLLESELFGHERGAFTGAVRRRTGRLEEAAGGVVLLDEIGDVPPAVQAKLLRVLEVRHVTPLGSNEEIPIDVRFIAATSRDLGREMARGRFRRDLFYRLNVLPIRVPPLRERRGDVPLLLEAFLARFAAEAGRPLRFAPEAVACLDGQPFPGNVRELMNLVRRLVLTARGETIRLEDLPPEYRDRTGRPVNGQRLAWAEGLSLSEALRSVERELIRRTLERYDGHRGRTARALGISRKNLWEKIRAHGLAAGTATAPCREALGLPEEMSLLD